MFSWLRKHQQRRAAHKASWAGFDNAGAEGVTKFQAEMLEALRAKPGIAAVELVKGKESYYKGTLAGSGQQFYIYEDETELAGAVYERWAFDSRDHLMREFLNDAAKGI